ncbi:MAG: HU family DNA-binding protein [Oscillospiraceae bacterium]|nr:HU family DNA-binding protein [Oscillospiraceae bacterium]
MSKTDLVGAVAAKTETSKKDAEKAVNATLEAITQALANGDKVQLIGFGTFEVKERAERIGRNPQTKQEIIIPASKLPSFKAGKALKDAVSK